MDLQMRESIDGLRDGRRVPVRDPPQGENGTFYWLEPLVPGAQGAHVLALVHELLKRLQGIPDGHIDRHEVVAGVGPHRRGVAILRLQAPDEPGTLVGKLVDRVKLCPKALHDGRVDWRPKPPNVDLDRKSVV